MKISGEKHSRVFNIGSNIFVNISNLTIEDGYFACSQSCKGGGIFNQGILTLVDCVITDNVSVNVGNATPFGGGIENIGSLTIFGSIISHNTATAKSNGDLRDLGGGITIEGPLTIDESIISENSAGVAGGGIFNNDLLTITNSTISGNKATDNEQGIG